MSHDAPAGPALYADRDAINPRAFAVRHMVIEAVKLRLRASPANRAALERVARGVSVDYDSAAHDLVVALEGREARRIPLDGLTLYARGDAAATHQQRGADPRHWDSVLEANRRVIDGLVDAMLRTLADAGA